MTDAKGHRSAFTLIEVIATLLLVVIGVTAVIGMSRLGVRWSGEAMAMATGMVTANSLLADARPGGRTPDVGDLDGDDWGLESGTFSVPATGAYGFTVTGIISGYYARRTERSVASDVIDGHGRYADVEVNVFWGTEGRFVAGLKRRIVRRY